MTEIELCVHYFTNGFPDYSPICLMNHRASLKCHSSRHDCKDYGPSPIGHYPNKRDYSISQFKVKEAR